MNRKETLPWWILVSLYIWITVSVLLTSGCGPWLDPLPFDYKSNCGVMVRGITNPDAYQAAEDRALLALERFAGYPAVLTCIQLHGSEVEVRSPGATDAARWDYDRNQNNIIEEDEKNITGLSYCPRGVLVNHDNWEDFSNSLTHEFGHLLEGCQVGHPAWKERGLYDADFYSHLPESEWP